MKTFLIIFGLVLNFAAQAQEIPEVAMASGRALEKVQIIEVTPKGVMVKHTRGKGLVEFSAFTKDGIIQAGGADLWAPAPPRGNGKLGEPGDITQARKSLAADLKKLPTETKAAHDARVHSAVIVLDTEMKQAITQHKELIKKADAEDKEGIDSTATRKEASHQLGIALACGFGYAQKTAEAKETAGK